MPLPIGTGYKGYVLYLHSAPGSGVVRAFPGIYGTDPGYVMQQPADDGHSNDFPFSGQSPSLQVGQNVLFDVVAGEYSNYAVNLR